MATFISYYRVSTKKQGASGLGLEAQEQAVHGYLKGVNGKLVCSYTEVESGKRSDRPELQKALAHCKRSKATLLISRLDRLSRNVAFLSALMDSGAEFLAVDNPTATRLTVHILAAIAEFEAKAVSERTKAALAMAKARGVKLGSHREGHWAGREHLRLEGLKAARKAAAKVNKEERLATYSDIIPLVKQLREQGTTLEGIALRLNEMGHNTRKGRPWGHVQILRLLRA